jgi:predicted AlkP superfamily pyrophosphatase or phosphodiesterase
VAPPRAGGRSIESIIPSAALRLGVTLGPDWAADQAGCGGSGDAARGIVLLLADGLGVANLAARRGHAPFLWEAEPERLTTVFPSTTVAALGSLGTGLSPGVTALAGYSLRDPATGQRATLNKWDTPTAPTTWQPHPTLFERFAAAGRPATFIGEARFEDSAMTLSSLRGARFVPAETAPAARVAVTVGQARRAEGLIYLYWGDLDKIGHAQGWESPAWAEALEALDGAVRELAQALPRGWELWVTADHGMVDVTGAPLWDVRQIPALSDGVSMVAGEARAVHVYTDQVGAVVERWRSVLGEGAWVLTRSEAIAADLFGPVDDRVLPYLGDVIVALAGRGVVVDAVDESKPPMIGHHGSLTAQEMEIPLIRLTR